MSEGLARAPRLRARIAPFAVNRRTRGLVEPLLARPSVRRPERVVHIYYVRSRISFLQVFPYVFYEKEIARRYRAGIRLFPVEPILEGKAEPARGADVVLLQTWFTIDRTALRQILERIAAANPGAEISFLDSFAHSDVRLARDLDPFIRFYLKKSLFRDPEAYFGSYRGDTVLTQYYGDLYGIEQEAVDWETPRAIVGKLRLSPNFFTAPRFIWRFARDAGSGAGLPALEGRGIDIHARGAAKGTPWYTAMRRAGFARLEAVPARALTGGGVPWKRFMAEMRDSKLCFSPFGYGEVCWRDVEAFLAGAVLVKPDMGHLSTLPELYSPGETYLPTRWDFADLPEVVEAALGDAERRRHIARTAYDRILRYVRDAEFVDDIGFLFGAEDPAPARGLGR